MKITEIDAPTGEITTRDATPEEAATHAADVQYYAELRASEAAAIEAKLKSIESAKEKLAKLGLTIDEVTAILG
jgi:hypothetical protein